MKLLTKEVLEAFKKQGDCSEKAAENTKIICKFFNPTGRGTWYCYEYQEKDRMFYAFVDLIGPECAEAGPVSLDELKGLKLPFGLGIERDRYFGIGKHSLKEVMDGARP